MPWLELHLRLTSAEHAAVEEALESLGALAQTLTDAEDNPVLEPAPGETPLWPHLKLQALFAVEQDPLELLAEMEDRLPEDVLRSARFARLCDRDWTRAWMDHYQPMRFGRRLWIYPTTVEPPADPEAVIVRLDPGLAFGTGTHPTTALCLEWLDGLRWQGETLFDYGCGSGILAVAALRLGAGQAHGLDNDPQALVASRENAQRNGVAERLSLLSPRDPLPPPCDRLAANILLNPLIELAERIAAAVKPGGAAVFSGMLKGQEVEFIARYRSCFQDFAVRQREDWIRITATRR
ncbi:MAG: 50S ribosomal protein L11 methyltransferase [Xanthomonadales bacterium PRO6]|nr:Ribosomal protein L11 methyltransferase [Xanthomonadales bacterium]MCE7930112.1 50S ribosomal protein L11 methyltransferase [Xanthomonadales bacterium PRO6]